MRPLPTEYAPFYDTYVSKVQEDDLIHALQSSLEEIRETLVSIPVEKSDHAYDEGKWTVKQVLQHVLDAERVFSYRALCIARGEQQALPSFDENSYAALATVEQRHIKDMKEELLALRSSVYLMFRGFDPEMLMRMGTASGKAISANALGYIIIGHARHHFNILRERYGI
jgi:hypothetical protein